MRFTEGEEGERLKEKDVTIKLRTANNVTVIPIKRTTPITSDAACFEYLFLLMASH